MFKHVPMFANISKHDIPDDVLTERSAYISYYMKRCPFRHFSHILASYEKTMYDIKQKNKQTLKHCCILLHGPPYRCFGYINIE